jgi:sugar O-acyltransferase (sialic acid O-acetyltransferase NeuD family)
VKRLYGVYGASGFGRETMPFAREAPDVSDDGEFVFIDDAPPAARLNGHRVLTFAAFLGEQADEKRVSLAISDSAIREKLAARCSEAGIGFFTARAGNAVALDDVKIGEGAIVSPFVTFTSNIRIGRHFHANIYSYVAHDCVIGDFVTFAPAVRCNGNVRIEDHAYLGTGAILRQGKPGAPLTIGKGAIVGQGAVVLRDVPPGVTVVGNPARPLVRL